MQEENQLRVINLTPHVIHLYSHIDKQFHALQSEGVARVTQEEKANFSSPDGYSFTESIWGETTGLPDSLPQVVYIVSSLVRAANPNRKDLYSPSSLTRDDQGRIAGCMTLTR